MKIVKIVSQVVGILLLIPGLIFATLRFDNRTADGPSILFPGGELVSGILHTGPDPDWGFTDDIFTVELQLNDPMSSRLIYIIEAEGKIYVVSGYMSSTLGRIWKHWAVEADEGDGMAVLRISTRYGDTRYERRIVRIEEGDVLNGVSAKLITKYFGGEATEQAIERSRRGIEAGNTWAFELAPR
jgi:hypothetical protein